jgi:hypothetical protein
MARAAHKCGSADHKCFCQLRDDFLAAKAILRGKNRPLFEQMSHRTNGARGLRSFAGNNAKIEFRQFRGIVRRGKPRMKFVSAGDAQPILVQRFGVLRPSHKRPHLGDFGQVRRVQASNRTATDNADSLDQIVSARGISRGLSSVRLTERFSSPFFHCADVRREP